MPKKSFEEYLECPFHLAMTVLEGRWKFAILYVLSTQGTLRFKELESPIPGISTRMLTKELKHLTKHAIVKRVAYPEVPPRVEYSLTDIGKSIKPVIDSLTQWGEAYWHVIMASREKSNQVDRDADCAEQLK